MGSGSKRLIWVPIPESIKHLNSVECVGCVGCVDLEEASLPANCRSHLEHVRDAR